jgi:hypothetical protein
MRRLYICLDVSMITREEVNTCLEVILKKRKEQKMINVQKIISIELNKLYKV